MGLGVSGRVPNHSDDLARDRSRKGGEQRPITQGERRPTSPPKPDRSWHPIAKMLWESLFTSGQADFYQDSDWAFAYSICDDLSFYKKPLIDRNGEEYHKRSGQMLQTIYSAMERLLVTEGDRRRVRIELNSPEPDEQTEGDAAIADYEQGLRLVPPLESETTP